MEQGTVVDGGPRGDAERFDSGNIGEPRGGARAAHKVDLLVVIDNSPSMADKQQQLALRIPELIERLTADGARGTALTDLHVAVITTSLGSHGTPLCAAGGQFDNGNDRGHLLPRPGGHASCSNVADAAPLEWTFAGNRAPSRFVGSKGSVELQAATSCVVQSARESGCGYENSLEAMYHFLIDPEPYLTADAHCTANGCSTSGESTWAQGVDEELLQQRAAFLREDSVVAVVLLSDENDASLRPARSNWLPLFRQERALERGWASCEAIADDIDDGEQIRALGCEPCFLPSTSPNCGRPWPSVGTVNVDVDSRNLRAFATVQRFGYNFLWPLERYVSGLSNSVVASSQGRMLPNPLFAGGRARDQVLFAAIAGVPKDLVTDVRSGQPLDHAQLNWAKMVGPAAERDPRMLESIGPRAGMPRFSGELERGNVLTDPALGGNGGDRDIVAGDDLQYACIGPRPQATPSIDCADADRSVHNPLCTADAKSGLLQRYAKAYPGLRQLRVAQALGTSGFVASICAESYSPFMALLADRIRTGATGR